MTRTISLLAGLFLGTAATATAQISRAPIDETPPGGLEEAAALYFAPPTDEAVQDAIDLEATRNAGAVALAIALGQVEQGMDACRELRLEMQELIGDTYGSYAVNPGWLRTYQNCLVRRGEEADAIREAIEARQRELIERTAESLEAGEVSAAEAEANSEAALRAADLMARLSARQSAVRRALRQEGRMQQAFVRYYNTGVRPDALNEAPRRPSVAVPAGERPLGAPAPVRIDPPGRRPAAGLPGPTGEVDDAPATEPAASEPSALPGLMRDRPRTPEATLGEEEPLRMMPGPSEPPAAPVQRSVEDRGDAPKAPARATGAPVALRPASTE